MESIEKYLSKLTNCEQDFFSRDGLKAIKFNGTIDFKNLHDFLKATVKEWEKLPEVEKLKHFFHLWTIEADLSEILEDRIDVYGNGRRRALNDVEELLEKMQDKWV